MAASTLWRPDAAAGPYGVRIERGEWQDAPRLRSVPYKIYRPEHMNEGAHPVVMWSHGLGGTRDGAGFLGRYMASHGYIHVHIQHDGTDDSLWRGMDGHPWDNIRKAHIPWETVRNRYLDAVFAADQLEAMNAGDALLAGKLDLSRLGMSGHSFGALTTQVMCGQLAGREAPENLADARFRAGVLYSPVPAFRHQLGGKDVYATIDRPMLHMTGSADTSPVEGFGPDKRLEVFEHAGNPEQTLFFLNGADHMVYNGSRGQLEAYEGIARHQDMINILSLAWWQWHLNGDANARAWVEGPGVAAWLEGEGYLKNRG